MVRTLHFDAAYAEEIILANGIRARLRLVRPTDKAALERGLMRLSPESQYLRFFTAKVRFTPSELRYLTELDDWNHLAIAAIELDGHGAEIEGIGVARFVRLPEEPTVAEPAVTVVDTYQGQGLGSILMERLIQAALERGIERFRSEFLAINTPMRELFERVSDRADFRHDGPVIVGEFPLSATANETSTDETQIPSSPTNPIFEWLHLVAEKAVALRQRWLGPDAICEALYRSGSMTEDPE